MKFKTTRNEVLKGYPHVFGCGYCQLQTLLQNETPRCYAAGTLGWNWDGYEFGPVVLVTTGYRPIGKPLPDEAYDMEEEAQQAYNLFTSKPHEEVHGKLMEIRDRFAQFIRNYALGGEEFLSKYRREHGRAQ